MSVQEQGPRPQLRIRRATLDDLANILRLEVLSFPSPWPQAMFERELADGGSDDRFYIVAEFGGDLAGYAGMWTYAGEAHVGTIAVASRYRQTGVAEILMLTLLSHARRAGVRYVTLEYRITNEAAARLYRKIGFSLVRIRKGYYSDTHEDGVEVAISDLQNPGRQQALTDLAGRWSQERGYDLSVEL